MKITSKLAEATKRAEKGWLQELSKRLRNQCASERLKFANRSSQAWKPAHFQTTNANKLAKPQARANCQPPSLPNVLRFDLRRQQVSWPLGKGGHCTLSAAAAFTEGVLGPPSTCYNARQSDLLT
jgi:hypothetical protein